MVAALPAHPPQADVMKAAATQGHKAVQWGDLAGAGRAADALEKLLDGVPDEVKSLSKQEAALPPGSGTPSIGASNPEAFLGAAPAGSAAGAPGNDPLPVSPALARPVRPPERTGRGPGHPVFDKGRQTWEAVRKKLDGDMRSVLKGVAAHPGANDGFAAQLHARLEPILEQLDDSLALKLSEIARSTDEERHVGLVTEAQQIVSRYKSFIAAEPLIAILDQNPFCKMTMRKTLDAALAALSGILSQEARPAGGSRDAA